MTALPSAALTDYIASPFGTLHLEGIHIGRFRIDRAIIQGREAAINLQECILAALDETGRKNALKKGTRYPEPLPMGTPARPLAKEIEDHLEDMRRRQLDPKTVVATERTLKLLLLTCGNISACRVDYKHIQELWKLLRWAPKNLMSDPLLKRLTFSEAIALGKEQDVPPLAGATEERHRRFLVAFFNHLVNGQAIASSPMKAFRKPKEDHTIDPEKAIRLFEDADLQAIFDPATFVPWAKKPQHWWAPMLGLYTGARVNEVCQLKLTDIIEERGVWCIAFQKTLDPDLAANPKRQRRSRQSMKGVGCMRIIPIAKPLLEAGFLEFVEDMRETGHHRLFPLLSAGVNRATGETNARYSQQFVVDFGRYLKSLGFPRGVGFHAFRHTLATELDVQDVPEREIALVTGHATDKRDRVQVLRTHYLHKKPQVTRGKQISALKLYQPKVELPRYQRGQFAKWLSDSSKFYP
ncbi:site-specific integrase [Xanthomonas campestris pv. campestris]|uniref:site-specific integrase n=1 Tax=Xanthomonas campestris TaxID=339 RepID=UPI002AD2A5DC|nr:site-specific integrase [Xanthomonas campestris]MEA0806208.1 site-specific integrase [Xanthomonas campestris pv. campestris]MEB1207222.1 site-specific integrase [Xanthomonas campestris pv. campestris]MEB1288767.1 site-specific integrase [Xanthomonas campestris pv. campestris]MEB1365423.1 site-specific integrase [Xanthomonas campestris pv. campestris]MEB1377671.1 site-specific integrase [Xanthomonas campestris pv. campestris]